MKNSISVLLNIYFSSVGREDDDDDDDEDDNEPIWTVYTV